MNDPELQPRPATELAAEYWHLRDPTNLPIDDEWRADEYISGLIQRTPEIGERIIFDLATQLAASDDVEARDSAAIMVTAFASEAIPKDEYLRLLHRLAADQVRDIRRQLWDSLSQYATRPDLTWTDMRPVICLLEWHPRSAEGIARILRDHTL